MRMKEKKTFLYSKKGLRKEIIWEILSEVLHKY